MGGRPGPQQANDGAPDRVRTGDRLIRSQTLYPAELRAHTPTVGAKIYYMPRQGAAQTGPSDLDCGLIATNAECAPDLDLPAGRQ